MRMTKLVGRIIKETPRDAELPSHKFLLRAGYVRQYSAGIYGLLPLAHRSILKIEKIVREEMNRVQGQEIRMPCMMPKELWDESGRYSSIGKDMFRLNDRNDKPMLLGMTHEEPVVFFARTELTSYKQLPAMLYQVQTKFRDEPRPRGGLIRLREFSMKDAYSFHTSEEDLKKYYFEVHEAYMRVFKRAGCKNFVSVLSDNGMFGGKYSHEFMTLVPTGEDTLITCTKCNYKANQEIAFSKYHTQKSTEQNLEKIHTPGQKTIDELATFLKIEANQTCKAVMYQTAKKELVVAFVRGDLDVVEPKLQGIIQTAILQATPEVIVAGGAVAGSTGPVGLNMDKCIVVVDNTVLNSSNLVVGANEADYHLKNLNIERDFLIKLSDAQKKRVFTGDFAAARAGDPCPECGADLQETRGIEIGNIFHLGTRYSKSMGCTYLDQQGKAQNHVMGCYGIGMTRLLPSVIEESHDQYGMILPISIAPFEVHFNVINRKDAVVLEQSEKLYNELTSLGIEVLMDDRDEKPGFQFADADLMGVPLRVIMSPKTLAENSVEFKFRDGREPVKLVKLEEIVNFLKQSISSEYQKYAVSN